MRIDLNKLTYKKADNKDLEEVRELATDVVLKYYSKFISPEIIIHYVDGKHVDINLEENLKNIIIVKHQNELVGFIIIKGDTIYKMLVAVKHHKKRIGSHMLKYAEEKLFEKHNKIKLKIFEKNTFARSFYIRRNWVIIDRVYDVEVDMYKLIFEKCES